MKNIQKVLTNIIQETSNIFWVLFKVILPVIIIIRALGIIGSNPLFS